MHALQTDSYDARITAAYLYAKSKQTSSRLSDNRRQQTLYMCRRWVAGTIQYVPNPGPTDFLRILPIQLPPMLVVMSSFFSSFGSRSVFMYSRARGSHSRPGRQTWTAQMWRWFGRKWKHYVLLASLSSLILSFGNVFIAFLIAFHWFFFNAGII